MARNYNIDIDSYIGYPISKGYVKSKLEPLKGKPCTVRINSYGGDVMTALDIRQQFLDHGDVTVYIVGMTASAATILAMGAKKVVMSRYALMLVHQASGFSETWGYYNKEQLESKISELRKNQAKLDTIDRVMASIYAVRSKREAKEMAELMSEGRWITAEEALKYGLIDEIDPDEEEQQPEDLSASAREHLVACGFPLPVRVRHKGVVPTLTPDATANGVDTDSALNKVVGFLRSLFGPMHTESTATAAPIDTENTTNNKNEMNKKTTTVALTLVCAALGLENLTAAEDGSVTLSKEQLNAVEGALAAFKSEKEAAESKVKELGALDGDTTGKAGPTAEADDNTLAGAEAMNFYNKFKSII